MNELTDADLAARQALQAAVFPPEQFPIPPGSHLEWSSPGWTVHLRDGSLLGLGDLFVRNVRHDGMTVRIGGVGNVKTHPAARRRGLAGMFLDGAMRFFQDRGDIAFVLLVCEPRLLDYYARHGWTPFDGKLFVTQGNQTEEFTFARPMTRGVTAAAPTNGVIDLLGPPW